MFAVLLQLWRRERTIQKSLRINCASQGLAGGVCALRRPPEWESWSLQRWACTHLRFGMPRNPLGDRFLLFAQRILLRAPTLLRDGTAKSGTGTYCQKEAADVVVGQHFHNSPATPDFWCRKLGGKSLRAVFDGGCRPSRRAFRVPQSGARVAYRSLAFWRSSAEGLAGHLPANRTGLVGANAVFDIAGRTGSGANHGYSRRSGKIRDNPEHRLCRPH